MRSNQHEISQCVIRKKQSYSVHAFLSILLGLCCYDARWLLSPKGSQFLFVTIALNVLQQSIASNSGTVQAFSVGSLVTKAKAKLNA